MIRFFRHRLGRHDFQVGCRGRTGELARQQQQGAGIDPRFGEQSRQYQLGHLGQVGCLGQFEGEAAECRCRAAHLGDVPAAVAARLPREKPRLVSPVSDLVGLLITAQHTLPILRHLQVVFRERIRVRTGSLQQRTGIGKDRRNVMHKLQLHFTDMDNVFRLQHVIALNRLSPHTGPIAAVQVAQMPPALDLKDFGVIPTAAFVLDHDVVGRRTAKRHPLARHQTVDVGPLRTFTDDQIS